MPFQRQGDEEKEGPEENMDQQPQEAEINKEEKKIELNPLNWN